MNTVFALWESHWVDREPAWHEPAPPMTAWHFTECVFASSEAAEAYAVTQQMTAYDVREYMVRR